MNIEALDPHLARGFTLQSQLCCGTYPLSIQRQQQDQVLQESCPYCPDNTALRAGDVRSPVLQMHRVGPAPRGRDTLHAEVDDWPHTVMLEIEDMHKTNM